MKISPYDDASEQKKEPRSLLRVVEFRSASRLFPEEVVDIPEGLLEHAFTSSFHV
jgi:hypothetical protein